MNLKVISGGPTSLSHYITLSYTLCAYAFVFVWLFMVEVEILLRNRNASQMKIIVQNIWIQAVEQLDRIWSVWVCVHVCVSAYVHLFAFL